MENRTRGHSHRMYKKMTWTLKKRAFSVRAVKRWNEPDDKTGAVDTVEIFKRRLGEIGY